MISVAALSSDLLRLYFIKNTYLYYARRREKVALQSTIFLAYLYYRADVDVATRAGLI
jgi:hypothetical protein